MKCLKDWLSYDIKSIIAIKPNFLGYQFLHSILDPL